MPGGRNSGAVYNLYKVKYKKHKKNGTTASSTTNGNNGTSGGQGSPTSGGSGSKSPPGEGSPPSASMGILKSALSSNSPYPSTLVLSSRENNNGFPGYHKTNGTATSTTTNGTATTNGGQVSPPSSNSSISVTKSEGPAPTMGILKSALSERAGSAIVASLNSRLDVSRVMEGNHYNLLLVAATAAALHQKEVDESIVKGVDHETK
jgi:hypothetical protein